MRDFLKPLALLVAGVLLTNGDPALSSDPAVTEDKAHAWLEHIRKCRREIKSIRADFVQERIHPLGSKTSVTKGTLEARRGGRFRLAYTEPSKRLLVSDGDVLWAYNPGDETAVRSPTRNSLLARLLGYFVDGGDKAGFTARYMGGDSHPQKGERAAIELVPETPDRFVESIILTVTESCPAVIRVMAVENRGPVIRMSIDNIRVNDGIGLRRFLFVPPKKARIIEP